MAKTKKSKDAEWYGWHFLAEDKKLRYGDGRIVRSGRVYRADVKPVLCEAGMHASKRPLDALQYAPGPIICYVRLSGDLIEGDDKTVARERKVIWMADATNVLHEMAVWVADRALKRERKAGREPDPRSWAALQAKRGWLAGKVTDAELGAAWDAAWDAARGAAWGAAWGAARGAAWGAARGAAWGAAWGAEAAEAAERDAQNTELERRLLELAPKKK